MLTKQQSNTLHGSFCLFSFVGWAGSRLLNILGWVDVAMNLDDFFNIFDDPRISWGPLYLLVFIYCTIYLITNNVKFFKAVLASFKSEPVHPDKSIRDAIDYIIRNSSYGTNLSFNEEGADDTIRALESLVKNKKITLFGVTKKSPTLHKVDEGVIKNSTFKFTHNISRRNFSGADMSVKLALINNGEDSGYRNFFVSKSQLKEHFPHKNAK